MSSSYIQMPSAEVKKLAQSVFDRIEERNKRVFQKRKEAVRRSYEESFFRRLFRLSPPSEEQIEKEVREEWQWSLDSSMYGWKSREIARNLLLATEKSDTISVSVEDLGWIS